MRLSREEQAFAAALEGGEAPAELAGLARLAQALERVRPGGPQPDFRNALRNRLIAEVAVRRTWLDRVRDRLQERNAAMRRSLKIVVANGLAVAVLLAGGSVFALAGNTVPGDALWSVKRLREDARLLITRSPEARGFLQMELARVRLEEVRTLLARHQDQAPPYVTALNDMDARTLDATKLLVALYRSTNSLKPLGRLTQFATAQKSALEGLVDRLPPAARPPARDSIDILNRVSDRVTGILQGCPCPANPLVPQSGPPAAPPSTGGSAQTPACSCSRFRGDNRGGSTDGGSAQPPPNHQPPSTPGPGNNNPPPNNNGIDLNVPDIPGTTLDNQVEDSVNNLIDSVLSSANSTLDQLPLPVDIPSIPPIHL
jgi:hypothetical protein